ncbi:MAG TPA: hypothetical protein VFP92_07005 [Rhodanobacteraceae bacterium]|nr:hypothetical protein [Rhodanobacteraceae bacterium]
MIALARAWPQIAMAIALSMTCPMTLAVPAGTADVPPGYSTSVTGSVHDFDYFMGSGWITHQHRLKARGVGSHDWEDFPGILCAVRYLDGIATVDELYFPTRGTAGLTLRTFDPEKRQWSIYWVSGKAGTLDEKPVVGGFDGKVGRFYARDRDARGRAIKVRFIWKYLDRDHARWEQAISYDNRTWETDWTADFIRADRTKVCKDNRPRHDWRAPE